MRVQLCRGSRHGAFSVIFLDEAAGLESPSCRHHAEPKQCRGTDGEGKKSKTDFFEQAGRSFCRIASVVNEMVMEINFDRACLGAGSAKRGGGREVFPVLQAAQMGCDHGPNRALVSGAVTMAADVSEDRADIETGTATDAVKGIALFGVGEQLGAFVVENDEMKFLRAVNFAGLAWTTIERIVTGEGLARACGGEHGQEKGEVIESYYV